MATSPRIPSNKGRLHRYLEGQNCQVLLHPIAKILGIEYMMWGNMPFVFRLVKERHFCEAHRILVDHLDYINIRRSLLNYTLKYLYPFTGYRPADEDGLYFLETLLEAGANPNLICQTSHYTAMQCVESLLKCSISC